MALIFRSKTIGTANAKRRRCIGKNSPIVGFGIWCFFFFVTSRNPPVMISFRRAYRPSVAENTGGIAQVIFCHGWNMPSRPRRQRITPTSHNLLSIRNTNHHLHIGDNSYPGDGTISGSIRLRRSLSTSTTLFMVKAKTTNKWEVGDLVGIVSKNDEEFTQKGEVVSIQGSGWYSVRLLQTEDDGATTTETIKCRGTQLQRLAFDINDGKVIPSETKKSPTKTDNQRSGTDKSEPIELASVMIEDGSLGLEDDNFDLSLLPTPTIYDLDVGVLQLDSIGAGTVSDLEIQEGILRQVAHHAMYQKWVVFTDLHCSPATLDTCLEVLDIVHETALNQTGKCGVLFLGDFWHHRGTLRVDCLNAILGALRSWQVPMVMIPGNHDQVTLGGQNHGLTPLENAYRVGGFPGPLILSHPTRFRNALFVPHIRDKDVLKAILSSKEARDASALFVHAEVRGALMNDMIVSTQGIPPSIFPSHKHIYSGHFHKPHCVETSSSSTIEYVGSPYQVSLAEAQQEKHLTILGTDWKCEQRVPINVGRRHFKLSSLEELQQIRVDGKTQSRTEHDGSTSIRKGDRIVVSVPNKNERGLGNTEYNTALKSEVQLLRDQGLVVELREISARDQSSSDNRLRNSDAPVLEEMSAESTWRAYLEDETLRTSISESDHESLLRVGLEILEEIESGSIRSTARQRDLRLTSTTVTGFGPFEDTITYPLDSRGLVLLRGSNNDYGPDSNGTGKSSLAMATLWALTGSLDARPATDLKVADVVNDNSKAAKVTVEGYINGVPFVISRSKTASRGDLTFQVNDVDLTTQSAKETQAIIEEKLGVDAQILTRVAFYGQHGMNDLLEATDSKLKDELSLVVPLDLWQDATSIARARSRQTKKKVDEMEGMIKLRKTDVDALSNRVARAKESRDFQQRRVLEAEKQLDRELTRIQELLDRASDTNVNELQTQLEAVSIEIKILNDRYDEIMAKKEVELNPLDDELVRVRNIVTSMSRQSNAFEMDVRTSKMTLDSARARINQVEEKWSLDLTSGMPSVLKAPEHCPTCNQLLQTEGSEEGSGSLESAQKKMELEIEEAHNALHSAENTFEEASLKRSECSGSLEVQEKLLRDLQLSYEKAVSIWNTRFEEMHREMREKRTVQNTLTSKMSMAVKESQLISQREAASSAFNEEKLKVKHANEVYDNLENELNTATEFLKDIAMQKEREENNQAILSSVGERFGQRGVQTFVLQNTVDALERTSQYYLDFLSDGSQRLQLSLDAGDKILRNAFVRGADGEFKQRPLSTLSGGQWRRCSLALSFGFAELIASTGRLRSSLLVLDEPLTHLDRSGRTKFGELVRKMLGAKQENLDQEMAGFQISTAIVILQDLAAEELEEAFDGIDTVIRKDGRSRLNFDEMSSA